MNVLHICFSGKKPEGVKSVLQILPNRQRDFVNNVKVYSINRFSDEFETVRSIREFYKIIKKEKPDIVVFHSVYFLLYASFAILLWFKRIPYAITLHGALSKESYKVSYLKKRIANFLFFKRFIKKASSIIYLNENEYNNSIVKNINPKYTIISNGCNTVPEFEYYFDNDAPISIVYVGRINRVYKGLDLLFQAIDIISESDISAKVKFVFYGVGAKTECEWFEEQIAKRPHITEFNGAVYGTDKDRILKEADIFILTSRSEGMPMGVLEALSYGLPCILTPGTNFGDEVVAANAGWLTSLDPEEIANTIKNAVCQYPASYKELRKNSLELSRKYNWSRIAENSIAEYSKIIEDYKCCENRNSYTMYKKK